MSYDLFKENFVINIFVYLCFFRNMERLKDIAKKQCGVPKGGKRGTNLTPLGWEFFGHVFLHT